MSERIIHGKPGSGKSCYCVSLLVKMLSDWVDYEYKNGKPFERLLYTNIPLSVERINEYLRKETGIKDCDAGKYIVVLDDTFFAGRADWWEEFENGAMVVIDEVHHYLPASIKKKSGGQDIADLFMNYVSTHRHRQQDIIFLTQHLNNIAVEIKRMAEVIYEVLNIKNATVGIWPFKVRMEDIDLVRQAWGYPVQLAHIKRGICAANSVEYDKNIDVFSSAFNVEELFSMFVSGDASTGWAQISQRPVLYLSEGRKVTFSDGKEITRERKTMTEQGAMETAGYEKFSDGLTVSMLLNRVSDKSYSVDMDLTVAVFDKADKSTIPAADRSSLKSEGLLVQDGQVYYVGSVRRDNRSSKGGLFTWDGNKSHDMITIWLRVRELKGSQN